MKHFELILFDLDGTLLDFEKAERLSMNDTLTHFALKYDDETIDTYKSINESYWKMLERGEITEDRLSLERHRSFFSACGFEGDVVAFQLYYENQLRQSSYLLESALDVLAYLKTESGCQLAIVTNGFSRIQTNRIALAKLDRYFEHIYISEQIGYRKPQSEFFEHVLMDLGGSFDKQKILIVGDSFSSDIQGGAQFGIRTCWINPSRQPNPSGITVDYDIQNLTQLIEIIKDDSLSV